MPLASVRDTSAAVAKIAETLGLTPSGPDEIARHLEGRRLLLVLDNVEQLLPDLADILGAILPARGGSRLLVTSREPLHLEVERLIRVPVLDEDEAERLLVARAEALGVRVPWSPALRTLVRRLDRLPLALQLAAARLSIMSVEQVLDRLGGRLDLPAGNRDADPRHRTLRATIDWSHDLLSDDERRLFRRLAVFAGGWTLEASEAVCGGSPELLQALVDRSLVERVDAGSELRFELLDSIGQFAFERLAGAGEEGEVRARHAAWFRDLAERVDASLRAGEPEERWVALLEPELDNLRAAVAYASERGDAQLMRRIAAALPTFWVMHGRVAEGQGWLRRALDLDPTEDDARRRLYAGLAILAWLQQDYATADRGGGCRGGARGQARAGGRTLCSHPRAGMGRLDAR